MKEWYRDIKKSIQTFFEEYGKLFFIATLTCGSLLVCTTLYSYVTPHRLEVSFLDIGQGDAIFIRTPSGHSMLIDGGVDRKVLERLAERRSYFDKSIDVMVATHADADHITGLIPVLDVYDVGHVVVSPLSGHTGIFDELTKKITEEGSSVTTGKEGDEIIFGDGVVAHILYPGGNFHGNEKDTNDASVCILLTYGNESVLLTGDLPSVYEGKLLTGILPHHVTIYKAGHHGSKYSNGDALLSYIRPEYSVVSAGKDNRYGHPNPEAVGRLEMYSQEIVSTINKGTISFLLDGENVEVKTGK